MIEWMCAQGRWNPEVGIIFDAAVRHRRATVRSNHDARPDDSTLHTGAVRPPTGFVERLFFISPLAGHGTLLILRNEHRYDMRRANFR
jgi:hypothetical protein